MQLHEKDKTITCWLPQGACRPIMEKLMDKNVLRINTSTARGSFVYAPVTKNGMQEQSEFDVLTVIVEEDRADEIFAFIYFEGNVDQWGGGFMFMGQTSHSTMFALPELHKENAVGADR